MDITFFAHACFRLASSELTVVTDPYTPGPEVSCFDPVNEPADLVVMSSDDDPFHSDASHIAGGPRIVNALALPREGETVAGVHITPYRVTERARARKDGSVKTPGPCAMYSFSIDGIRVLHMGDLGTPLPEEYLARLEGGVDLLFALAGDIATIALDDLMAIIDRIRPKVVIPMHYHHPRGVLDILPVTHFLERFPAEQVTSVGSSELTLTPDSLPAATHVYVLEQCR